MTSIQRAWRGGKSDWRLHVLSVFSVAVAFVCLASALLVVVNMDGLRERWSSIGRASVYFRSGATPDQVREIERAVRQSSAVTDVRFVSSEDARRDLLANGDDKVLSALPVAAFPASLEVQVEAGENRAQLETLAAKLEALPAVESVETYQNWTARLTTMLRGGVTAALVLALVVFGAVVSVVASTIRMALQRRQTEVEVLKLVGATDGYVRKPFVLEGAAQGGLGALLALGLLGVLYAIISSHVDTGLVSLLGLQPRFLPVSAMLMLVFLGSGLGALAAWSSLRRLMVV